MTDTETVTIDGTNYAIEDLTDKTQYVISQIQEIQELLNKKRREVDRLAMSLDAFNAVLKKEVEDVPVEVENE
tara:strand:- start:2384 stop:2602 length:219 start_codon:yes stop_codon:yes gene_type:complete